MTPRPLIFISAVSRELRSARQLVANTLTFLGYQPIWQDVFGTESGDLREMLRKQIDQCKGVVQLVGKCYGAEPPAPDEAFGRVSYTQYEALYARSRGKKVWYLFLNENFPADSCESEPEELRELQGAYRRRVQSDTHVFHSLVTHEALEAGVLKLRDDFTQLRRGVKKWALGVTALLVLVLGTTVWLVLGQHRQGDSIQKQGEQVALVVDRYQKMQVALQGLAEAEARAKEPGATITPEEQRRRAYAILEKQLALPAGSLARELPGFALELYHRADTNPLMRARAAYALGKFDEAQKLSLENAAQDRQAYENALRVQDERRKRAVESYMLAGQSAQKLIKYNDALNHFREAEKLTDRNRNPEEWATVEHSLADLLFAQGRYAEAEKLFRRVIEVRTRVLGPQHADTLESRHRLIYALTEQAKHAEAEKEAREVLRLREKSLGPENADTVVSRYNFANALVHEGKYPEAETIYHDVIKVDIRILGPEHFRTIAARDGLANVLDYEGKNTEAQTLYRDVIKLDEKVYGPEHPVTLNDRMNLATSLQASGQAAAAEAEYRNVIRMETSVVGAEHPDTLISRNNLAETLDGEGRFADAEAECRQIIPIEQKVLGAQHRVTLNSRANLALALIGEGNFSEAETEYTEVLKQMEQALGFQHPDLFDYASKFVTALSRQHRSREASDLARNIADEARKILGANNSAAQKYGKLVRDADAAK
ncbi:MAG: tetratricopeptide repeat protein [Verrucomicrobiota bacterium]|nr:tetratricopeptide repeat protein [Verrucomicrobiota bacterium]